MKPSVIIRHALFAFLLISVCFLLSSSRVAAQSGDLSVTKTGPATASPDTNIVYTVTVSNRSGDFSAPQNTLTDSLPPGTTFVSESHSSMAWSCSTPAVGGTGTISCSDDNNVVDGEVDTFTFTLHINANVSNGTGITNIASVSAPNDPNEENNSSSWFTTVGTSTTSTLGPHDVLISEFRFSGPGIGQGGTSDEYVELYCNRNTDCDISGASLRTPDPGNQVELALTFPSITIIPARQYLLVGDASQYSLSNYGQLDFDVHNAQIPDFFQDNQGVKLVSTGEPIVLDSVGFTGSDFAAPYIEGNGLQPATSRPADQYAYVRKRTPLSNSLPQDTDDNASDFVLVSVTGTAHPGITAPPVLGAPAPQGLTSPLSYSNSQVTVGLTSPSTDSQSSPNRERNGGTNSGTVKFRRSFTNNTNQTLNYIAFRVIQIPTLNSPITDSAQAQLRLITSTSETLTGVPGRGTVQIQGTTLEFDPGCGCQPSQPNGGGLNSAVSIVRTNIPPGSTIDVSFLLQVDRSGVYRFVVYVEGLTLRSDVPPPSTNSVSIRANVAPHVPLKMINLKRIPRATSVGKKPKSSAPVPTKSFIPKGAAAPVSNVVPMPIVIYERPVTTPTRHRRKLRARHKSSTTLRAKAEARNREDKTQN